MTDTTERLRLQSEWRQNLLNTLQEQQRSLLKLSVDNGRLEEKMDQIRESLDRQEGSLKAHSERLEKLESMKNRVWAYLFGGGLALGVLIWLLENGFLKLAGR